jgi:hypothetical protein
MQHEWIDVRTKLGDDEGDALRHQPGDEGDVTGEPIELGDNDRRRLMAAVAELAGSRDGGGKLRAAV